MSKGIKMNLELSGSLADRFRKAHDAIRVGTPAALVRRMVEDWLAGWEAQGSPGLESPVLRQEKPRLPAKGPVR
jgi:hypothetical protein